VPLAPEDVRRLRAHRLAIGRPPDGAFVFATPAGLPLPAQGLPRSTWRRLVGGTLELASPHPVIHDLRHTYATHALAAGLSVHAVAKLLGHEDASLVLRRYGHALPHELASAGETLSAWREASAGT
jgi:integrase